MTTRWRRRRKRRRRSKKNVFFCIRPKIKYQMSLISHLVTKRGSLDR